MPVIGNEWPTLIDLQSRTDQNGNVSAIMEMLARQNPIITDAIYQQCNDGTKHRTVIRTGIPEPAYRRFNRGVPSVKTTTIPVEETTAMLEAYHHVDKELAEIATDPAAFRLSEATGIMQGFNDKVSRDFFYGSTAMTPEGFMGMAPRYGDATAKSASQIVNGGGTGSDNMSIWFITWGDRSTHLLYPKGAPMGLQHKDLGEDTVKDADGLQFQAYRDWFRWHIGLSVRDWEGNVRIANIDRSDLTKDGTAGADLIDLLIEGSTRLNRGLVNEGKTVIYANRTVMSYLRRQARHAKGLQMTYEQVLGWDGKQRQELFFDGFPIHQTDALLNTEAAVTGL